MVTTRRLLVLSAVGLVHYSSSLFGMDLTRLNEIPLEPTYHPGTWLQISTLGEAGIATRSYNGDGECVNSLRIYNKNQNALAMLKGFPSCSPISELLDEINATDDGVRGHFELCGDVKLDYSLAWAARYFISDYFSIAAYLPFYSMHLENVQWNDLTKDVTPADQRVKELLTNRLFDVVNQFGCGLDLGCWRRTGPGDLAIWVEWNRDFPQEKPFLKNVRLVCRTGLILPTGLKEDVDKIGALPFGNDGAVSLMIAGGLTATLGDYIQAGFDVELLHLFGNERERRIRVYPEQTTFLYLKKARTYRDWGLTQRFNLFLNVQNFYQGFSAKVDYEYMKHGEDTLSVADCNFSTTIANTGNNLDDWTIHMMIGKIGYDFACHLDECAPVIPQVWIYGKVPVNGSHATGFATVGAILSLEF